MRLIDADKVKTSIQNQLDLLHIFMPETDQMSKLLMRGIFQELDNASTIDAVPVVRCKDCRWGKEKSGNIECNADMNVPPEYHGYEWFCPNGDKGEK